MIQILDRISLQYAPSANETKEKRTNDTKNARYTNKLYGKCKRTNTRNEQTNHWSVTIYYPMTNDPGSIEVQYSILLLF